jgi:hypothetical protein
MAAIRGCLGVVEIGPTPTVVGEVTAYTINAVSDEIDTSSMGTCTASSIAGTKKTTGTISANFDPDDAGQLLFVIGTTPQLIIKPEGTGSGLSQFQATAATILANSVSAEVNGVVSIEMSYSINGEFDTTDQT